VGAECTGKTQLASQLARQLQDRIPSATWVAEHLRAWCDAQGRTPQVHEQRGIAQTQMERVLAHSTADLVLSDTAPLVTAVYSELLFGDDSLYGYAIAQHRHFALTLLTGLDLPWVADGFQRDGPALRMRVDQRLRAVMLQERIAFSTVYGSGDDRCRNALGAIEHTLYTRYETARAANANAPDQARQPWVWHCERCSDTDCEHRLFRTLVTR
jgi:nicotinamide riboside kinase